ncbi:MAG TPA: O-antigen ligase family protein [Candidatus Saccharimonadales bacterium]|nr:O-antigen ligase family protein [Candidatus Saccharimonadales bacterium]
MRSSTTANKLALWLSWLAGLVIVLLPFHAFLTVWAASGLGHYTALRLWKEVLLVIMLAGTVYILASDKKLRRQLLDWRLFQAIAAYALLSLVWGFGAYLLDKTTPKALGYGLTVNLRFLAFFIIVWVIATKSQWLEKVWLKLLLLPAAVVVIIGFLQRFALPYDVLKHFGYSENTIFPYQTINHDIHYPRIMSTLRGANPLGAYMVLVISAISVQFIKIKGQRRLWGLYGAAAAAVLFFSHSRGAWLGLAAGLFVLALVELDKKQASGWFIAVSAVLLLVLAGAVYGLRNNTTFENYLLHTNDKSVAKESSNEGHISAFRSGLSQAAHEPLGRGVGTAGPASVYNDGKSRIAENYYIQLTQEMGWLGLAVFLVICYLVAVELWVRRGQNLALILLVSFTGIAVVNLVSHAWTDDTLAYLWWGLAGVALATPAVVGKK